MGSVETDWKQRAGELADAGVSQRQIAEELSVPRSSVGDFLRSRGTTAERIAQSNGHVDERSARERLDEQAGPGEAVTPIDGQRDIYNREHQSAVPLDEILVDGTVQLGLFDAGGKRPRSASVTLSGGKVGLVDGKAFRKGDTIKFSGEARIVAIKQQDKVDAATGIPVSCEQQHTARITDLRVG